MPQKGVTNYSYARCEKTLVNPNYEVFHNSATFAVNSQKLQKNGSQANKIDYNYELFFFESTGMSMTKILVFNPNFSDDKVH